MPSFYLLTTGSAAQAQDVNQIIQALRGDAGQGIPISLTALSDSTNFVLALKNADPTNSRVLQVLRANNNVLLQADASGVIVSPDGGAASAQVVNISLAQTLTNKTLTSPHMTSPVVDSGGLTVAAGTTSLAPPLVIGATAATTGSIRLPNNVAIAWRNAANLADDSLGFDTTDRLVITGVLTASTATAGVNGALPAQVAGYMNISIPGIGNRKLPYYND